MARRWPPVSIAKVEYLGDMRPAFALCHAASMNTGNRETSTDFFIAHARLGELTNLQNFFFSELGHAVIFAVMRNDDTAALIVHVVNIVCVCTYP